MTLTIKYTKYAIVCLLVFSAILGAMAVCQIYQVASPAHASTEPPAVKYMQKLEGRYKNASVVPFCEFGMQFVYVDGQTGRTSTVLQVLDFDGKPMKCQTERSERQ